MSGRAYDGHSVHRRDGDERDSGADHSFRHLTLTDGSEHMGRPAAVHLTDARTHVDGLLQPGRDHRANADVYRRLDDLGQRIDRLPQLPIRNNETYNRVNEKYGEIQNEYDAVLRKEFAPGARAELVNGNRRARGLSPLRQTDMGLAHDRAALQQEFGWGTQYRRAYHEQGGRRSRDQAQPQDQHQRMQRRPTHPPPPEDAPPSLLAGLAARQRVDQLVRERKEESARQSRPGRQIQYREWVEQQQQQQQQRQQSRSIPSPALSAEDPRLPPAGTSQLDPITLYSPDGYATHLLTLTLSNPHAFAKTALQQARDAAHTRRSRNAHVPADVLVGNAARNGTFQHVSTGPRGRIWVVEREREDVLLALEEMGEFEGGVWELLGVGVGGSEGRLFVVHPNGPERDGDEQAAEENGDGDREEQAQEELVV